MIQSIDPTTVIYNSLESLDISVEHTAASLRETEYWLQNNGINEPDLVDLTHLPFVTMDNEDSRDLDQALYITRTADGYQIMYALADAAWYIRPGSALFDEALQRGSSYYTPLLAASMLPTALSEGLISLNEGVLRRSLVFDMLLDQNAAVTRCDVKRARIKSCAKLSYAGVQQWLDSANTQTEPFHESLLLLREAGEKLIKAGEERGVVRFDRTDVEICISGTPARLQPGPRQRYHTERYNEQLSLLCNMQGAQLLLGLSGVSDVVQAVYRVHEAPLRKNLGKLRKILDAMADAHDADDAWRWQDGQSLAAFVESLPDQPKYQRRVRAIQRQIMQAQRSSEFTPDPGEHHALKVCSYARFSSPMREIVGIFTHKELLEALNGSSFDAQTANQADEALREQVIQAANQARQRQRQLDKKIELATLLGVFKSDLEADVTRWHSGTIMGMRSNRLYVSLDELALNIKVYVEDLESQWACSYELDNASARPLAPVANNAAPQWLLGDGVKVHISSFDASRQKLVFNMFAL